MNHVKYDLSGHATKDTIKMLTFLLEKVIKSNDSVGTPTGERRKSISHAFTCFQARSIPTILVYFDRMSKSTSTRTGLRIDSFNIHRLIISGVMVASKLFSDIFFTNTRYAKVGGLPVSELNLLELEFLSLNDFALFVSLEELQHYGDQLLSHWTSDNAVQEQENIRNSVQNDELEGPVRRRARHLSIDATNNVGSSGMTEDTQF
ncbi:hypothetical protein INT48_004657 [Thamnidium elegans]|uniref:Cyclin n=1 Tax=Thamnidium elegans TaxID=101142 RepID=A0A8H7VXP8_9FUNG|nr:hypothetical protein INT48_004657 [Thamnidium elegans]